MGELRGDPSEIIPYARQDFFDLGGGFLRKRRHQVGAAGAMLGQPGPDCAHEGAGKVRHPVRIGPAHQVEQRHGGKADQRIDAALETSGISLPSTAECPPHRLRTQKCTTILPNTCRLASRSRPAATSASSTSVSITGVSPPAILARLPRMLPMVAPNEPMIRYCCWNSCIRLSVALGPEVAPQVTRRPPRLSARSEPLKVSAPTCSNTTSTPFFRVSLRTACSNRSVR